MHRFSFIILTLLLLTDFGLLAQERAVYNDLNPTNLSLYELYNSTNQLRDLLNKGEAESCLELANRTLQSYESFPEKERYFGYILSYKAQCLKRQARYESAEIHHLLVDWYADKTSDKSLKVSNMINYSNLESDKHNYKASIDLVCDLLLDKNGKSRPILESNRAKDLMMLGLLSESDSIYSKLAANFVSGIPGNGFDLPLFYRNYGKLMHKKWKYLKSHELLTKSLEGYCDVFENIHYKVADTHRYLAELLEEMDSVDQAYFHYRTAICSFDHTEDIETEGMNSTKSLAYETIYLDCLRSYCSFVNRMLTDDNPVIDNINLFHIYELIQGAETRINSFLQNYPPSESAFILTRKVRALFDEGIQLALSLYEKNEQDEFFFQAFEWSIRSSAYSLRLESERERMTMNNPDLRILRNKQKELFKSMDDYKELGSARWLKSDVDSLEIIIQKYDLIGDSISAIISKKEFRLGDSLSKGFGLIESSEKWKQTLVNYHYINDSLMVFILNRGQLEYLVLDLPSDFEEKIAQLKTILQAENQGYYSLADIQEYEKVASDIYSLLFQPIEPKLKGRNILILPDKSLCGLPFSCLVDTDITELGVRRFRDMNFLLKKYEIQYWMGTTDKVRRRGLKRKSPISISCPDNDSEKAVFGENSLTEVFEPSNLNNIDHQNQAIHIASHFIIDKANPLKSGLVCASDLSKPYMNLEDILAYDFNNSKVFINGCNTGNGEYNSGEGQMSMGLVFGIAGTRDVISHYWQAEDYLSALLARRFYRNGIPRDYPSKLHKVKRRYLQTCESGYDHPHFWAGVVSASKPQQRHNPIYLYLILIISIGAFFLYSYYEN